MSPWRKPSAQHDPGKTLLDLALSLAVGGDCLADIATVREQPAVFGSVASDATVSRLIGTLAADGPTALTAINSARAVARKTARSHAGEHAPDHAIGPQQPLIVDLDATLVTAHSEKENTAPNFNRGFGFHPFLAFVDYGPDGTDNVTFADQAPNRISVATTVGTREKGAGIIRGIPAPDSFDGACTATDEGRQVRE